MARTLVVGDVHGCARELGKLVQMTRPTRLILVGDLFTKGHDALGVWKLIQKHDAEAVLGNHDQHVLDHWTPGHQIPRRAFRWLDRLPLRIQGKGWGVVHAGFDPRRGGFKRVRPEEALHLRTLTGGKQAGRHWWRAYRGRRLVIHGHDARSGLVDRRPFTLGLDTACVKGGKLTGYLLEKDRIITVPAKRAYVN